MLFDQEIYVDLICDENHIQSYREIETSHLLEVISTFVLGRSRLALKFQLGI